MGEGGREGLGAKLGGIAALITALVGVATFLVVQQGGSSAAPKAPPATTTASASSAPATPPASPSSPSAGAGTGVPANGTLLGSYALRFPGGDGTPLPATPPPASEIVQGETGDVWVGGEAQAFSPSNQNRMVLLPAGSMPSYQACLDNSRNIATQASSAPETAFCIIAPGRMIGMRVTARNEVQPFWVDAQVTVWQNVN